MKILLQLWTVLVMGAGAGFCADLQLSNVAWDGVATAGQTLNVRWAVTNAGPGTASGQWHTRILLFTNATDSTGYLLSSFYRFNSYNLPAGTGYADSQPVILPGWAAGTHYLAVQVDSGNLIPETDETNNTQVAQIQAVLPDLVTSGVSWDGIATAGQLLTVHWAVTNQGPGSATGQWYTRILLLTNQNDSTGYQLAQFYRFGAYYLSASGGYVDSYQVALPGWAAGGYYLSVQADSGNLAPESDENNNTQSVPISSVLPDLVTSGVSWDGIATAGQSLTVHWAVTNQGPGSATGQWYTRILLLTNQTDSTGYQLAQFYRFGAYNLSASGGYVDSYQVALPGWATGGYYLSVQADSGNLAAESDENNNTQTVPISSVLPDLVTSGVSWDGIATAGQSLTVHWAVTNQGPGSATGQWYTRILLLTNQNDSTSYQLAQFYRFGAYNLSASGGYVDSYQVALPGWATGGYYLSVQVDSGNLAAESDENNNTQSVPITTVLPDLALSGVGWDGIASAGQNLTVKWAVTNLGPGSATGQWYTRILLFTNQADNIGYQLANFYRYTTYSLGPGAGYSDSIIVSLPAWLRDTNAIAVRVDSTDSVAESDKSNNLQRRDVVALFPDLVLSDLSWQGVPTAGQNLTVHWAVTNAGPGFANGQWYTRIVLYTNLADSVGYQLASFYNFSSYNLSAGQGYAQNWTLLLPAWASGTNYIAVNVDSADTVAEGNEGNNVSSSGISITNLFPGITLLTPSNSVALTSCIPVRFAFNATARQGSLPIRRVEYYDGDGLLAQVANSPYRSSALLMHGVHALSAVIEDTAGKRATSQVNIVEIDWPADRRMKVEAVGGNCVVCMGAEAGSNYVFEATTNLVAGGNWQILHTTNATGQFVLLTNQISGSRFFRARRLP